ncbi:MAG TPA: ATP-binding cassette domain-containing protein [Lactobacillaceae bacterium]|jgi:ABC-2 type transport system ATP-binding protein
MTTYAIETHNVVKHFKNKKAVNGISLQVKEGEIFAILGPNGAGKSTFLKMITTLAPLTSGNATIFGYDIQKQASKVRQLIGLTGQYASVDEELSGWQNLMVFARLNGLDKGTAVARSTELLEQFSLTEAKDRPIKEFSGGMRRRLDLAVSLITKPKLVFLDEPTTGLDPRTRGEMWDTIRDLVKSGSTILLTTQYLEEADQLADHIAVIDRGVIVAQGTADELKAQIGDTYFEVELEDANLMGVASDVIRQITGAQPVALPEMTTLSVAISDTHAMLDILVALKDEGINVGQFGVRKPSLDEVFLKLTGAK